MENSTADLMRWSSRQRAKTDKVTFRLLMCVRSTDRSVCAETWVPSAGNPYIYMYTHVCECILHIYIHMCQPSKTHYLSSGFFCCDEILWLKAIWEGKGLFCPSSWKGLQGRNGAGGRKCCRKLWRSATYLLALHGLLSLLSYSTQDWQPRCGTTHSEPDPLSSVINQENASQVCQ